MNGYKPDSNFPKSNNSKFKKKQTQTHKQTERKLKLKLQTDKPSYVN